MKKRLLLLLCMIACVFSLVACNDGTKKEFKVKYDEEALKQTISQYITEISKLSKEDAEAELDNLKVGTNEYNMMTAWMNGCEDVGELVEIRDYKFTADEKSVICKIDVDYEIRDAEFTFIIYADSAEESSVSFTINYTLAEKMEMAGLNTLLGMGTVFLVLILIAWVISLFKYINKFGSAKTPEVKTVETKSVDNTIAQIVEKEVSPADDLELIAVITAAIAASEGTSAEGLVVRSIKRVNKSKWQRA